MYYIPCDILPFHIEFVLEFSGVQESLEMRLKEFLSICGLLTLGAICHGLIKNFHVPAGDRTGDPSIYSLALYHVAIKAGLYRKAVKVYYIPCDIEMREIVFFLKYSQPRYLKVEDHPKLLIFQSNISGAS